MEFSYEVPYAQRVAIAHTSLLKSEAAVALFMLDHPERTVEATAQEVADQVGVARSSVIRTVQALGYKGYPQLRVALARELPLKIDTVEPHDTTHLGRVRKMLDEIAVSTPAIAAALTEETLQHVVEALAEAGRIVCVANGFSTAVALDLGMRLAALGLPAEHIADSLAQQFTVAHLRPGDCCFVVSASGQNAATIRTAQIAKNAGATVIALCSFPKSPLALLADHTVIATPPANTFRKEVEQTSRIAQVIVVEALVNLLIDRYGEEEVAARRARIAPVVGANLID